MHVKMKLKAGRYCFFQEFEKKLQISFNWLHNNDVFI
jgi:hypothetical protein